MSNKSLRRPVLALGRLNDRFSRLGVGCIEYCSSGVIAQVAGGIIRRMSAGSCSVLR